MRPRASPLTHHPQFQVPLEGTAVTLGLLGVGCGAAAVWALNLLGLTEPTLGPIRTALIVFRPEGFLFTYWRWSGPAAAVPTLCLEILLWSFFGVAIARSVVYRIRHDAPLGVHTALRYAWQHWTEGLLFLGLLAGMACLLALPFLAATLVGRLPLVGTVLGTLVYIVGSPLLLLAAAGLVGALLAAFPVGYLFLPAALAAEEEGTFVDAASRAVGYAFARPFLFVWDTFKGLLFAYGLYFVGIWILPALVKGLPVLFGLLPAAWHPSGLGEVAALAQRLLVAVLRLLTGAFVVAYLFGAGAMIYLNLRLEVDGVPFTAPAGEADEEA